MHGKTVFLIPRRCRVYLAGRYGHMPSDKTFDPATPSTPSGQMPCDKATRRRRRRLRHLLPRDLLAHSTAYPPSTRHSSTHPSTTRPLSHSPTYFTAASPSSASPSTRPRRSPLRSSRVAAPAARLPRHIPRLRFLLLPPRHLPPRLRSLLRWNRRTRFFTRASVSWRQRPRRYACDSHVRAHARRPCPPARAHTQAHTQLRPQHTQHTQHTHHTHHTQQHAALVFLNTRHQQDTKQA